MRAEINGGAGLEGEGCRAEGKETVSGVVEPGTQDTDEALPQ